MIVYEVIGIVKKKLGEIKSEGFRSEATLTRSWLERRFGSLVGAELGRESGDLGGGGKGRHLSPFIPRSSISRGTVMEKKESRFRVRCGQFLFYVWTRRVTPCDERYERDGRECRRQWSGRRSVRAT